MPKLYDELRSLIDALEREKIEYALCGGIAVAIHGHPRATVDIDMLVHSESLPEILRIAAQLGYTIRGLDLSFGKDAIEIRRVSKIDPATRFVLTLDMILLLMRFGTFGKHALKQTWRAENYPSYPKRV